MDDIQGRDDGFLVVGLMDKISLRYSDNLHKIDWTDIIEHALPSITSLRSSIILHASGQFAINPLLILAKVIQDQKVISHLMESDEEFKRDIKTFTNDLSWYDQELHVDNISLETSALEYSLRKVFKNEIRMVNDLIGICEIILQKYDLFAMVVTTNRPDDQNDRFKRDEENEIGLEMPFASTECWQFGATHFGALETESSAHSNARMSSIDMGPSLFQKWGVPFDYLFSKGEVYAMHGGYFKKHSECSIEVRDYKTKYSTYYSHLDINEIEDDTFINQGEIIGRIQLDPGKSNCRCDWPTKSFLCATGPHIHVELRYDGAPATLQGKIIGNLRVKTGLYAHDQYCSDPEHCTNARVGGRPCSTTYTDLKTGQVICPVTKGSNIGRKQYSL